MDVIWLDIEHTDGKKYVNEQGKIVLVVVFKIISAQPFTKSFVILYCMDLVHK